MLSIVIPVFNEEGAIEAAIRSVDTALAPTGGEYEIVVVNDGSTDRTAEILSGIDLPHLQIITHPYNRGYSASIKTGIRRSHGGIIGITDADGTYPAEQLPALLSAMRDRRADMAVGARPRANIPFIRRPAKWIVNTLADFLVGMKIPDLNSGMRIFTRDLAERFMHLYPQRFSFTITITLAALTHDYIVEYVPIDYRTRIGKSTLSSGMNGIKNFVNFLGLIVRITTYFRPLRFFIWPALILVIAGIVSIVMTILEYSNITDAGLLLLLTGVQIGLFGLLAEVVVRSRNR